MRCGEEFSSKWLEIKGGVGGGVGGGTQDSSMAS